MLDVEAELLDKEEFNPTLLFGFFRVLVRTCGHDTKRPGSRSVRTVRRGGYHVDGPLTDPRAIERSNVDCGRRNDSMQTLLLPDVLEDLRYPANLHYQARS